MCDLLLALVIAKLTLRFDFSSYATYNEYYGFNCSILTSLNVVYELPKDGTDFRRHV